MNVGDRVRCRPYADCDGGADGKPHGIREDGAKGEITVIRPGPHGVFVRYGGGPSPGFLGRTYAPEELEVITAQ